MTKLSSSWKRLSSVASASAANLAAFSAASASAEAAASFRIASVSTGQKNQIVKDGTANQQQRTQDQSLFLTEVKGSWLTAAKALRIVVRELGERVQCEVQIEMWAHTLLRYEEA
ncbi:MAG: hypothetical protein FRX49_08947 [Trebouxia sp. A1-2]|nr:MAG: hypothetical protein FRX49_08947 [Trebouxia sp. A1-2]